MITCFHSPFLATTKLVFSSYANLHKLLSDADQRIISKKKSNKQTTILDSHIISASVLKTNQGSLKSDETLVRLQFEHLNRGADYPRICVFWDMQEENWSDEGCQLLESNSTHTQCGCQHLTHFALLALIDDSTLVGNGLDFVGLIQANNREATSSSSSKKETVITLEIATYLVSSICLLILVILSIQVR